MDRYAAAEAAEQQGDHSLAHALWHELAVAERSPVLFCLSGRAAEEAELWQNAATEFNAALHIDPLFSEAMESMGLLYLRRNDGAHAGNLDEAADWFRRALRISRSARLLTFLGSTLVEQEDWQAAKCALEKAIQIDDRYEEAFLNLATVAMESDLDEAELHLQRAIEIDPQYAVAHQRLGIVLQKKGHRVEAEYHFRCAMEIEPTDYWSHLYLANVLALREELAESESYYKAALVLQPRNPAAFEFFAQFLDESCRQQEAEQIRNRAPAVNSFETRHD